MEFVFFVIIVNSIRVRGDVTHAKNSLRLVKSDFNASPAALHAYLNEDVHRFCRYEVRAKQKVPRLREHYCNCDKLWCAGRESNPHALSGN